jgi:hypothetical protein
MMESMMSTFQFLTTKFKNIDHQDDIIFESVEKMINAGKTIYSSAIIQKAVSLSLRLEATQEANLKRQALMAYFFEKKSCFSTYCSHILTLKGTKLQEKINENIDESFELIGYCFENNRSYYGIEKLDYLLSVVMDSFKSGQFEEKLQVETLKRVKKIVQNLKSMGKGDGGAVENLLSSVVRGLPKSGELA